MTTRVPSACSLSQPEFDARLRWIRDEIPRARRQLALEGGVAWEFEAAPELRQKLDRLIELESECCSSDALHFSLHEAPESGSLRLELHGIDASSELLEQLGLS